jgi:hypothetical protein
MSNDALAQWSTTLAELGEVGVRFTAAIEADDLIGAISGAARIRGLRAELARTEAPVQVHGTADDLAALHDATELIPGARRAETALAQWRGRPLPGDAQLLTTPLGIAVLADAVIPDVWDYENDVVILVGAVLAPVAELLADLGQRRIVGVDTDATWPAGSPAVIATTADEVGCAIRMMTPCAPTRAIVRCAPGVEPDAGAAIAEAAHAAIGDLRVHKNTVAAFSQTWLEQGSANLHGVARWPSIDALDTAFAGLPMVIVAPGPSLKRNADQLARLRGRAVICAFSHSLKPVLAAGVTPDLVLTVDPQDVRYHFAGCDVGQTCLVNAATVHPALFELPAARMLTLASNNSIDDWIFSALGVDASCPGGGSVATTALSLALRWKCDPIVFVGLDLSFPGGNYYVETSVDGRTHASVGADGVVKVNGWSDAFHAMKATGGPAVPRERAVELPGWHGGTVPSSFMFSMFHRWFVERMRAIGELDAAPAVFNCTEGGAFIAGMQHVPLADVIARLAQAGTTVDATAILDAAIAAHDGADRARRLAAQVAGYERGLTEARSLAHRARRLAARAIAAPGDTRTSGALAQAETRLARTLAPLTFASMVAQHEVERAHDVATHAGGEATYLAASLRLFDAIAAVADRILPTLRAAAPRIGGADAR